MSHFSLKYIAPICVNETLTLEIDKDDIETLEAICIEKCREIWINSIFLGV